MKYLTLILFLIASTGLSAQKVSGVESPTKVSGTAVSKVSGVEFGGGATFSNTSYLTLDGTDDQYVKFLDTDSLDFDFAAGGMTIMFWARTSLSSDGTIICKDNGAGDSPTNSLKWEIIFESFGQVRFNSNSTVTGTSSTNLNDGDWHFYCFVIEADGDAISYYDSTVVNVSTIADQFDETTVDFKNDRNLFFGAKSNNDGAIIQKEYDGDLDMIMLWSRALSTTEIDKFADLGTYGATYDNDPAYAPNPYDQITDADDHLKVFWSLGEGDDTVSSITDQKTSGDAVDSNSSANTSGWSINSH